MEINWVLVFFAVVGAIVGLLQYNAFDKIAKRRRREREDGRSDDSEKA